MSFEGSTASKSSLSSLSLTNKVAAFREINGKARTYFHLQQLLNQTPQGPRPPVLKPFRLGPPVQGSQKLRSRAPAFRGCADKAPASQRGCRVDSGSLPGGQLQMPASKSHVL